MLALGATINSRSSSFSRSAGGAARTLPRANLASGSAGAPHVARSRSRRGRETPSVIIAGGGLDTLFCRLCSAYLLTAQTSRAPRHPGAPPEISIYWSLWWCWLRFCLRRPSGGSAPAPGQENALSGLRLRSWVAEYRAACVCCAREARSKARLAVFLIRRAGAISKPAGRSGQARVNGASAVRHPGVLSSPDSFG